MRLIGISNVKYLAYPVGLFFYYFIPIRKKVVIKNLSLAFPEYERGRILSIAKDNYINFASAFLEIAALRSIKQNELIDLIEIPPLDDIKDCLEKKTGAVFLTAHFGNWEMGALYIGLILNRSIHVLAKKQRNPTVSAWMKSIREKFGNKEILLGSSVKHFLLALKKGEIIGLVADQRAPRDSIRVNYFNRPTAVFTGAAAIALKARVPVFVILLKRVDFNKFQGIIKKVEYEKSDKPAEKDIIAFTQSYMKILEEHVRECPQQWFWMHNIWKY